MKFQAVIVSLIFGFLYFSVEVEGTSVGTLKLVFAVCNGPERIIGYQPVEKQFSNDVTSQKVFFAAPTQGSEAKPCKMAFLLTKEVSDEITATMGDMMTNLEEQKKINVNQPANSYIVQCVEAILETTDKKTRTYKTCTEFTFTNSVMNKNQKAFATAFTEEGKENQIKFTVNTKPVGDALSSSPKEIIYISFD